MAVGNESGDLVGSIHEKKTRGQKSCKTIPLTLNIYTGQNPRLHVVLKKTSQMHTVHTQFGRNLFACLYLYISFYPGGGTVMKVCFFFT
jgi:hypothetical protein